MWPMAAEAVAALKPAQSVIAFTPFVSDTLLEVCDVCCRLHRTETSGSSWIWKAICQSFYECGERLG